jgi:hypothetical protein
VQRPVRLIVLLGRIYAYSFLMALVVLASHSSAAASVGVALSEGHAISFPGFDETVSRTGSELVGSRPTLDVNLPGSGPTPFRPRVASAADELADPPRRRCAKRTASQVMQPPPISIKESTRSSSPARVMCASMRSLASVSVRLEFGSNY